MIELTVSRDMSGPPEAVFAQLTDFANAGDWMIKDGSPSKSYEITSEGGFRAGATYADHTSMGDFEGEVLEVDPPHRVVFRQVLRRFGVSWVDGHHVNTIEPIADGCRLTWQLQLTVRGPFWLLQPILKGQIRKERELILEALDRSLAP